MTGAATVFGDVHVPAGLLLIRTYELALSLEAALEVLLAEIPDAMAALDKLGPNPAGEVEGHLRKLYDRERAYWQKIANLDVIG